MEDAFWDGNVGFFGIVGCTADVDLVLEQEGDGPDGLANCDGDLHESAAVDRPVVYACVDDRD